MGVKSPEALCPAARWGAPFTRVIYFSVSETGNNHIVNRIRGTIPATLGRVQGGFKMARKVTIEEQLRRAQIEAARLREQIRKSKADARRKAEGSSPSFPGAHRGW
jgi:hypothetical protein